MHGIHAIEHHVFWIRAFREAGKAAQVTEQRGNFSTVAFELLLRTRRNDQIGYLRRKETSQSAHALDFAHLVGDALFKLSVQLVEIIEQPRILNGDDCLRGKILHQLNLLLGKWSDLLAHNTDCTDELIFPQHRHAECGSKSTKLNGSNYKSMAVVVGFKRT